MPKPCALLIDDDPDLAQTLGGWLESRLSVEMRPEWSQGLGDELDPAIVFVAVDLPKKAGIASCRRVRAAAPDVPIVLTTATIPPDELELNRQAELAQGYLDKRSLGQQAVLAMVEALVSAGPVPSNLGADRVAGAERDDDSAAAGDAAPGEGRRAALEAEIEKLRSELDLTRRAARDGDFLRLGSVVTAKEKEISHLRKEVAARERDLVTARRALRDAQAQAAAAKREREQATGHITQLDNSLESERSETQRLRLQTKQLSAEAAAGRAELEAERRRHAETRRLHEASLAAHADTLLEVKQEQQAARSRLESQLRAERRQAVATRSRKWRDRFERLALVHQQSRASLEARIQELEERRVRELAQQGSDHRQALDRAMEETAADAERRREELQRSHEASLAEALAAHAAAEERAEHQRSAAAETEARLREEHTEALDAAGARYEERLQELQQTHGESVAALRRHFEEHLAAFQAAREQDLVKERSAHQASVSRAREELATARSEAARLQRLASEAHERQLADLAVRQVETAKALEARLRDDGARAVAEAAESWEKRLEAHARDYSASLDTLRQEYADRLEGLSSSVDRELGRREQEHRAARRQDAEALSAAGAQVAQIEQHARERLEAELLRVETRHAETRASLESRLRKEGDEAVAAAVAAWEAKLQEQRRDHSQQLAQLRAAFEDERSKRDAGHEASLSRALEQLARVRADSQRERERLREEHQRGLEELRGQHAVSEQQAEETHREARHALESQLREERERAVAATAAEWGGALEALRQEHAAALGAVSREHQELRDAQEEAAAKRLADKDVELRGAEQRGAGALASARAEAARRDQEIREGHGRERLQAETKHREDLAALERRLRSEHQEQWAQASATWERELEELREAHAASLEALRHEHQERMASLQAGTDQERKAREAAHGAELDRLREELAGVQAELAGLQDGALSPQQHQEALEALESRLAAEHEAAVAAAIGEWKGKMERLRRGHADTLVALRREHQDQIDAIRAAQQRKPAEPGSNHVAEGGAAPQTNTGRPR